MEEIKRPYAAVACKMDVTQQKEAINGCDTAKGGDQWM
jgi:hypothetical protein